MTRRSKPLPPGRPRPSAGPVPAEQPRPKPMPPAPAEAEPELAEAASDTLRTFGPMWPA